MNDCKKFQTRFLPERGKEHTMGKYFGTDGFRGEANVTLTVEDAYKVGRFLGWYYGQKTKADRCRISEKTTKHRSSLEKTPDAPATCSNIRW